ncbi:hypothetical protein EG68_01431 [Paragonimus skrjabini miyazakii]|uniref:Uncharacterized protein n=1 Tax=Paragonimus skrjabini miyazakii TaxID=59628 RepID=A0A8S9Z3Y3_9TREM|nr:hypothetical protein EG68_01431 [Paragonimus skrjabini miyazakii]
MSLRSSDREIRAEDFRKSQAIIRKTIQSKTSISWPASIHLKAQFQKTEEPNASDKIQTKVCAATENVDLLF